MARLSGRCCGSTRDSLLVDLDFTDSKLKSLDAPLIVSTKTVQGTYMLRPGRTTLIGSITANDGYYVVATVEVEKVN